jgi:hypothetical protein
MADATGETREPLRVAFDRRIKLEFHGARITSDGGLLAYRELDDAFGFTTSGNSEIQGQWLLKVIRRGYEPAYPRLEQFLTTEGGRKYLRPLYEELMKSPGGPARARAIYAKARPTYHPTARAVVDEIVKK